MPFNGSLSPGEPAERLESIFGRLRKAFISLKGVGTFEAPVGGAILAAEAETAAVFYPGGFEADFVSSLGGVDLTALRRGSDNGLTLKSSSDKSLDYVIFLIEGSFYVLAVEAGNAEAENIYRAALPCLKLCIDFAQSQAAADSDPMTGLYNHGWFQNKIRSLIRRHEAAMREIMKNDAPDDHDPAVENVSLILFDIDNFKNFNDTYGHHAGDVVIKRTALAARAEVERLRPAAFIARYGGEEFAIVVKKLRRESVFELAENVRRAVESIDMASVARDAGTSARIPPVTISLGMAFHPFEGVRRARDAEEHVERSAVALIKKADTALYGSKRLGKNRATDYDSLPRTCVSVIERRGDFALVDAGAGQQLDYGDRFEVYDSSYDGSTEIVSPKTGKKLGLRPRLLKGLIAVSKKVDRFEATLMEKTAVCDIESETLQIGEGDTCVAVERPEKFIYAGDVFLPRHIFRADYYRPAAGAAAEGEAFSLLSFNGFLMADLKEIINDCLRECPARTGEVIRSAAGALASGGHAADRIVHLSSDKILFCFKKEPGDDFFDTASKLVSSAASAAASPLPVTRPTLCRLDVSALSARPSSGDEVIRFLRITGFVASLYDAPSGSAPEFNCQTYRKYALFFYYRSEYEKALSLLRECERLFRRPGDIRLYQNAGIAALKLGKTGLAIKYFTMAEKLDGSSPVPKANLGLVYCRTGAYEKAAEYYAQCASLAPENAGFHNNFAYCLLAAGKDLKKALSHAGKAVRLAGGPKLANYADTLAEIHARRGEHAKAAECYRLAIRACLPETAPAEAYLGLFLSLARSGDKAGARRALKAIKQRDDLAIPGATVEKYQKLARIG